MTKSTNPTPRGPTGLTGREYRLLVATLLLAKPVTVLIETSYSALSSLSGLSLQDTVLGLMQLWLHGCLRGSFPQGREEPLRLEIPVGQIPPYPRPRCEPAGPASASTLVDNPAPILGKGDYRGMGPSNECGSTSTSERVNKNIYFIDSPTRTRGEGLGEGVGQEDARTNPAPVDNSVALAQRLAASLGDQENLGLYRLYVKEHPTGHLLQILDKCLAVPLVKIRKSRAALFRFLLKSKRYEQSQTKS